MTKSKIKDKINRVFEPRFLIFEHSIGEMSVETVVKMLKCLKKDLLKELV